MSGDRGDVRPARRRLLIPEVIQTSSMDCGVASVKALFGGFGIDLSYGRLREACQTDVDGTSIDVIETLINDLGLAAEQIIVPADHLLLDSAHALPGIAIVRLPNGFTHFVVVWRRHGRMVQVMDPARGRRWTTRSSAMRELFVHQARLAASDWASWGATREFLDPLEERMRALGVSRPAAFVEQALADASGARLAHLDAAVRMIARLRDARAVAGRREAATLLETILDEPPEPAHDGSGSVPDRHWFARPAADAAGKGEVIVSGAVIVRVKGIKAATRDEAPRKRQLAASLREQAPKPAAALARLIGGDARLLAPLGLALGLAAVGVIAEAVLLRGMLDAGRDLAVAHQRLTLIVALATFLALLAGCELVAIAGLLRFGRRLETRVRMAFLRKIPRVGDRYLQSRLVSDIAERCHSIYRLRQFPLITGQALRLALELIATAAAIAWLDPDGWPLIALVVVLCLSLPFGVQRVLVERDLRLRNLSGALSRFYLDALRGVMAVRTHGAEQAVRREHEALLVEWWRAGNALQRTSLAVDAVQGMAGTALAAGLLFGYLDRSSNAGLVLLLVYWALNVPMLGQELALMARQYPQHRNVMLRLLELLTAPEEQSAAAASAKRDARETSAPPTGARVELSHVTVHAGGHVVLNDVSLAIEPGRHVGVVGPSGAGKSTLVGLLLGWHTASAGTVTVDGRSLDGEALRQLRSETAWLDPSVQLWNSSVIANLAYGGADAARIDRIIRDAELPAVIRTLPDGLQSVVGEGGSLLSGGEGQRVRFGRAMGRPDARLVVLDEPFRGLTRDQRRAFLRSARRLWAHATLICVTHDIGETTGLDHVVVVEGGRVVEQGDPRGLAATASRYRQLLDAEETVRTSVWSHAHWQRWRIEDGRLQPSPTAGRSA